MQGVLGEFTHISKESLNFVVAECPITQCDFYNDWFIT